MKVLILPSAETAADRAAGIMSDAIRQRPNLVLGLATGKTMRPLYARLVAMHAQGRFSLASATSFNLDEFVGVPPEHPASFAAYMHRELFSHVDIHPDRVRLPDGNAQDLEGESAHYESSIAAAGGIDLQLLGIGKNGHIAFNEPTSSLGSRTRVKTLMNSTRTANASLFPNQQMPKFAITMGIATVLDARACLMLATGISKAEPIARMIEGPMGADCPATALQFHPDFTVVLDDDAAKDLKLRGYYESVHPAGAEARLD